MLAVQVQPCSQLDQKGRKKTVRVKLPAITSCASIFFLFFFNYCVYLNWQTSFKTQAILAWQSTFNFTEKTFCGQQSNSLLKVKWHLVVFHAILSVYARYNFKHSAVANTHFALNPPALQPCPQPVSDKWVSLKSVPQKVVFLFQTTCIQNNVNQKYLCHWLKPLVATYRIK